MDAADPEMLRFLKDRCAGAGMTHIFFPDVGESARPAKAICRGCPIRIECREYALAHEKFGVWGGLTELERKRERKRRAKFAA